MNELTITTHHREEMVDITHLLQKVVTESGFTNGTVLCFVPHTTAGITINENADPNVRRDILYKLNKEIPQKDNYLHAEGNSDAHIKASLLGFTLNILFENQKLILGQWQGIYFCEFDGPRHRRLIVRVQSFD